VASVVRYFVEEVPHVPNNMSAQGSRGTVPEGHKICGLLSSFSDFPGRNSTLEKEAFLKVISFHFHPSSLHSVASGAPVLRPGLIFLDSCPASVPLGKTLGGRIPAGRP